MKIVKYLLIFFILFIGLVIAGVIGFLIGNGVIGKCYDSRFNTIIKQNDIVEECYETGFVSRVIDGDTIELSDGRIIRYIGINTPEINHPEKGLECYGPEATSRNRELVESKNIVLMKGIEDKDKYGRYLRYVFIDAIFINSQLVAEGFAYASSYGPERKFQQVLVQLQQYAEMKQRGLWAVCPWGEKIK